MPTRMDIRNQMLGDIAVKKELQQFGDDETQPHIINHQMLSMTEESLLELSKFARLLAFEVAPVISNPNGTGQFSCELKERGMTILFWLSAKTADTYRPAPISGGTQRYLKMTSIDHKHCINNYLGCE